MKSSQQKQIENTLTDLFEDSKTDYLKMMKGAAKSLFRPLRPSDFKEAYLSISQEQGEDLIKLIRELNCKHIVLSLEPLSVSPRLFLAQGCNGNGRDISLLR